MALTDVDANFVDAVSNNRYTTQTAVLASFETLRGILSDSYLNTNTCFLPDKKYNMGLALLILHTYALDPSITPDTGGGDDLMKGSVTGESVGDVSVSYGGQASMGVVGGDKAWLSQTRWGSQFLYLMKTFKPTPLVI